MQENKKNTYSTNDLPGFVQALQSKNYAEIENLCATANKQIEKMEQIESLRSTSQYTDACKDIIQHITRYISNNREKHIPYINELIEKQDDQHDCASCSGNCKINHDLHFLELTASHEGLKKILTRIQMLALPLYSETNFPDAYRVLRSHIALIENSISELYLLEGTLLIPKVKEAQNKINAGNK